MSDFAKDYIDVATRIAEVRGNAERVYPEGRFQPADLSQPFRLVTIGDSTFIAYVAAFYRDADDQRPGIGSAWEPVPGRTPYTRGSELQNAETSAWGRALVAALAADTKKGIASADEVRNRDAERDSIPRAPRRRNATTRSGPPEDPSAVVDEWTTPTWDVKLLADLRAKLPFCTLPSEVRALDTEAHTAFAEGRLTVDDARTLKAEMDQRLAELTAPVTA